MKNQVIIIAAASEIKERLARMFAKQGKFVRVEIVEDPDNDEMFSAIVPLDLSVAGLDINGETAVWDVYGGDAPIFMHCTGDWWFEDEAEAYEYRYQEFLSLLNHAFAEGGMFAGIHDDEVIKVWWYEEALE